MPKGELTVAKGGVGLTVAKSGTNSGKEWDYQLQKVGLSVAKSGTNSGKEWA